MDIKKTCIECNKTLRNYKKGEKPIHRKCWLKLRDKDDKIFDFLFCKDRPKEQMRKVKVIDCVPPIIEEPQDVIDIAGNIITDMIKENEIPPPYEELQPSLLERS